MYQSKIYELGISLSCTPIHILPIVTFFVKNFAISKTLSQDHGLLLEILTLPFSNMKILEATVLISTSITNLWIVSIETYWFQLAHYKWLHLGDHYIQFFHQSFFARFHHNKLRTLINLDNEWVYEERHIQSIVLDHYQFICTFKEHNPLLLHTSNNFPMIHSRPSLA
ncbi:hypothetical protein CR513_42389, partial [Mucuna pruriens]